MDALVAALTAWIVAQTGLLAPEPPRIVFVSQDKMIEMAFGPKDSRNTHLRALYSQVNKTIYLRDGWNSEDLRQRSELLHELVHHVQKFNNVPAPCDAALERQAYSLQFAWLREQGIEDPYTFLETNEIFVILLSTCFERD